MHVDTIVAYAPICDIAITPIHPSSRYREITACKSERAKLEKYSAWKLLEKVVSEELNLDFANLQFTKTDNGQWICPDFYFSISHTDGLVCVAVSELPIGVDAERVRWVREELRGKILTEREDAFADTLSPGELSGYLLEAWVKKESIFKKGGAKALLPNRIEADGHPTVVRLVKVGGEEYLISACTDINEKTEFRYMEEI